MSVIKFTAGDFLRSKIMEGDTWHSWQVLSNSPVRPNDKKDGYNWDVVIALIEHINPDINGKEVKMTFSTKYMTKPIDFALACMGENKNTMKPDEFVSKYENFEFDNVVGKKLDGKVIIDIYNGQPINKVEEYALYKSMMGKGPAF